MVWKRFRWGILNTIEMARIGIIVLENISVAVVGGLLVALSLVAAAFIVAETLHAVREFSAGRRRMQELSKQSVIGGLGLQTTESLESRMGRISDGSRKQKQINSMRDASVVRQMIEHFEEDESAVEAGD